MGDGGTAPAQDLDILFIQIDGVSQRQIIVHDPQILHPPQQRFAVGLQPEAALDGGLQRVDMDRQMPVILCGSLGAQQQLLRCAMRPAGAQQDPAHIGIKGLIHLLEPVEEHVPRPLLVKENAGPDKCLQVRRQRPIEIRIAVNQLVFVPDPGGIGHAHAGFLIGFQIAGGGFSRLFVAGDPHDVLVHGGAAVLQMAQRGQRGIQLRGQHHRAGPLPLAVFQIVEAGAPLDIGKPASVGVGVDESRQHGIVIAAQHGGLRVFPAQFRRAAYLTDRLAVKIHGAVPQQPGIVRVIAGVDIFPF